MCSSNLVQSSINHFTNPVQSKMKLSTSLAVAAAASSATAHTIFVSLNNGAVGDGVRVPSYDGVSFS